MTEQDIESAEAYDHEEISTNKRISQIAWIIIFAVVVFLLGFGGGYLKWGQDETAELKEQRETAQLYEQVNPVDGYTLPVSYGNLGPQLIEAGVIDYDAFMTVM